MNVELPEADSISWGVWQVPESQDQALPPSLEGLDVVELEGRLRAIHLIAHVKMRPVLTPEQVGRYDNQPGYAASEPQSPAPDHQHPPGTHQGMATDHP